MRPLGHELVLKQTDIVTPISKALSEGLKQTTSNILLLPFLVNLFPPLLLSSILLVLLLLEYTRSIVYLWRPPPRG
jgi:hypothetical protein